MNRLFAVVPHTHWDREWYWPFERFRLRLAAVVDEVLDVLERDPQFTSFTLDGQAIVLEDYLEIRPENERRLRALLAAGRIEVGPSYVLPDEFLVSGEALVRNLLIGRAVCERFGAQPSPVGYLPDSFGHPLQLPQILAGFGIETMIFSRGLGDELDEVGVVFRWRAPEGSQVLAFQQLPHYANFAGVLDAEEGERRVRAILERFGTALDAASVEQVLLCHGSDHLPITPNLPAVCRELERRLPGTSFTIARYADYERAVGSLEVPSYSGELLGSRLHNVLRGVNSSRLYIKQANERAEQALAGTETLAALRTLRDGTAFPASDFRLAWRELLRCHPHDTICGCSCDEVHRDALGRYESLSRTVGALRERSLEGLVDPSRTEIGVINLLPFRRQALVEALGAEPATVELDAFAARTVQLMPARPAGRSRPGNAIENERFRVEAAPDGTLSVLDKQTGRRLESLHQLEDELDMGDLYTFCPVDGAPTWRSSRAAVHVLFEGPVISELELEVEARRPVGLDSELRPLEATLPLRVRTVVRLISGSPRIEFRTTVENATRDHRLRVVFPAGAATGAVRAEGQFALVSRPLLAPRPRTGWAEPPDATQHTSGAVAVGTLALIGRGLPEYEVRLVDQEAELCLTLLRAVGIISRPAGVLATRPLMAGPQLPTPEGQCLGQHECEYALLPDGGELDDVALLRASQDYRCGFLSLPGRIRLQAPVGLEGEVIFSCLKGAEDGDGLILRCFNPGSTPRAARVAGELAVSRTRLDETGEQPLPDGVVELAPGQIATVRLRPRTPG